MIKRTVLVIAVAGVVGCSLADDNGYSAGDLRGLNHTLQGINWFSVNGYGGHLSGNTCCIALPDKWFPGLKARVEWETDPEPHAILPRLGTDDFRKAYAKHAARYQRHSAIVDIPRYEHACGLTVHFLPCNQVKTTASCIGYTAPGYPIKEPFDMKEPAACPK